MKVKDFKLEVEHEINQLKKHATKKEIANLDWDTFDPAVYSRCIYGQLTGNCESVRAKKLMDNSCIRVLDVEDGVDEIEGVSISSSSFNVNGKYTGQTWKPDEYEQSWGANRCYKYLSALEGYICTKGAKVKHIMDYLKDTTGTIKLKL